MTGQPKRIQLRRTRGWRKPADAIVVARPSRWCNPFVVHTHSDKCGTELETCPVWANADVNLQPASSREEAVTRFRHCYQYPVSGDPEVPSVDDIRTQLAGRDLACWCPLEDDHGNPVPCHADVLLEIANPNPAVS